MKRKKRGVLGTLRHSLLIKIMFACIMIFIVPVTVLYAYLSSASSTQAIRDAGYRYCVALKNVSDTMDEVFKSVNATQNQLQADSLISSASFSAALLADARSYASWEIVQSIGRTLYQYYLSTPYIHSIDLYNPYADILFYSRVYATRQVLRDPPQDMLSWVDQAKVSKAGKWYLNRDREGVLWFTSYTMPCFSNNPFDYQYARITINADVVGDKFESLFLDEGFVLTVETPSGCHTVMGDTQNAMTIPESAARVEGEGEAYTFAEGTKRYLGIRHYSPYTDWDYVLTVPIESFNTSSTIIIRSFTFTFVCLTFIFLALLVFLIHEVIKPINVISRGIQAAETGDLTVRLQMEHDDELGHIGKQFNVLLENIDQLIHESYEARMLKNEFELKFIQNQLKEHFLYNTLDSVHWIAHSHNVPQISQIIFHLSHFFRLTLNGGSDAITVGEAVEILKSYVMLINVRMGQTIDFDIQMDPKLETRSTYKYFFQPIVENAYQHGLRPKLGGHLTVTFSEEPVGFLRYCVTDDGVGMSQEKLNALRRDIALGDENGAEKGQNFALKNINRQLRLYFGQRYSFEIESRPAEGTTVVLVLPLKGVEIA